MRILGVRIDLPHDIAARAGSDLGALARTARSLPGQLDRLLSLGDEIVATGQGVLALGAEIVATGQGVLALGEELAAVGRGMLEAGERLDRRAEQISVLGDRLDARAADLLELGVAINALGERIDVRGESLVDRAEQVVRTGDDLVEALPTLERALGIATPLEGAIDRVGRFVDRLPGGANARRTGTRPPSRGPRAGEGASPNAPVEPEPPTPTD